VLTNLNEASTSKVNVLITLNNPIINIPALPVENTTYTHLELPEQNAFTYICGYLMSKCLKYHNNEKCVEYVSLSTNLADSMLFIICDM